MANVAVVSLAGLASAAVGPPGVNGPGLAEVGPVDATDGYPVWYRDRTGLRLEKCIAQADPMCPARGPLPDEAAAVSFPDNYPDEGFYSLTSGTMDTAGGGKALAAIALEQAFGSGPVAGGDQVTFARLRLKITNVRDGVDYKFTTPAGTKTVRTSKPGELTRRLGRAFRFSGGKARSHFIRPNCRAICSSRDSHNQSMFLGSVFQSPFRKNNVRRP